MNKLKLIMYGLQGELEVEREHLRELKRIKARSGFTGLKQEVLDKTILVSELTINKIMSQIREAIS